MTYCHTATEYARALFGALCAAGIEPEQARDCANNSAGAIVGLPEVGVRVIIDERLRAQRTSFGLVASNDLIDRASRACARVPRFTEAT